jgi:transposase
MVGNGAGNPAEHGDDVTSNRARGMDTKKKSLGAAERDEGTRRAWREETVPLIRRRRLIAVDEMAATISLTRLDARAPRNQRALGAVPKNHGIPTTLIAALSDDGIAAAMTLPGALNTVACEVFVANILAPILGPGDLVLLDNLSAHKADSVRTLIEATGADVLFLPPYSPDFNPIEMAFSKIKEILRSVGARTQEALDTAIAQAIDAITHRDAQGFFRHCGYLSTLAG